MSLIRLIGQKLSILLAPAILGTNTMLALLNYWDNSRFRSKRLRRCQWNLS